MGCLEDIYSTIKSLCTPAFWIVCTGITGPVLIGVGIWLLVLPNNRASDVQKYNDAVNTFFAGDYQAMQASAFMADGVNLTFRTQGVAISGKKDGVFGNGTSAFFTTIMTQTGSSGGTAAKRNVSVISTLRGASIGFQVQYSPVIEVYSTYYCRPTFGSTCVVVTTLDCPSGYDDAYDNQGKTLCYDGSACGRCVGIRYINKACFIVTNNNGKWVPQPNKIGCSYPWTNVDHDYVKAKPAQSTITMQIMSSTDPYIILQDLTKGSNDFGFSSETQHAGGIAMIVIGAIFLAIFIGVCCWVQCNDDASSVCKIFGSKPPATQPTAGDPYQPHDTTTTTTTQPQPMVSVPPPAVQQPVPYGGAAPSPAPPSQQV
eukprot:PhF_6_TR4444/c0_g1_i2/m.6016